MLVTVCNRDWKWALRNPYFEIAVHQKQLEIILHLSLETAISVHGGEGGSAAPLTFLFFTAHCRAAVGSLPASR